MDIVPGLLQGRGNRWRGEGAPRRNISLYTIYKMPPTTANSTSNFVARQERTAQLLATRASIPLTLAQAYVRNDAEVALSDEDIESESPAALQNAVHRWEQGQDERIVDEAVGGDAPVTNDRAKARDMLQVEANRNRVAALISSRTGIAFRQGRLFAAEAGLSLDDIARMSAQQQVEAVGRFLQGRGQQTEFEGKPVAAVAAAVAAAAAAASAASPSPSFSSSASVSSDPANGGSNSSSETRSGLREVVATLQQLSSEVARVASAVVAATAQMQARPLVATGPAAVAPPAPAQGVVARPPQPPQPPQPPTAASVPRPAATAASGAQPRLSYMQEMIQKTAELRKLKDLTEVATTSDRFKKGGARRTRRRSHPRRRPSRTSRR